MKRLQKIEMEEYKFICTSEKKNIGGKFLSHLGRKYESIILEKVINQFECDVKMFDGFLIRCEKVDSIEDTIIKLDELTEEYGIEWVHKEHDTSLVNDILKLEITDDSHVEELEDCLQDISKKLFDKIYKSKLVNYYGSSRFKSVNGWISNNKEIDRHLRNELTTYSLFIKTVDPRSGEYKKPKRISSIKDYKEIIDFLHTWVESNDKLLDEVQKHCHGKLYFDNGYHDIILNKFVETNDMNTLKKINKNWIDSSEVEKEMEYLINTVYSPMFGCEKDTDVVRKQLMWNFFHKSSRAMYGFNRDKEFMTMDGPRDGGKSLIIKHFENTYEKYVSSTSTENFIMKNSDNTDEAKSKSFMVDFIGCRLVTCSEIKEKDNLCFDGNKFKSFCSGGDTVSGRKLFENEQSFKLECGLFICLNDMPDIKPADAKEKQIEYPMISKFCSNEVYQQKLTSNEKMFRYYKKDMDLSLVLSEYKIQMAFVHILAKAFHLEKNLVEYPRKLLQQNEPDEMNDSDRFYQLFDFESEDDLTLKEIVVKCKEVGIKFQQKKIKTYLMNRDKNFTKTNRGQLCKNLSFQDSKD